MNIMSLHPARELLQYLAGWKRSIHSKQRIPEECAIIGAEDIVKDDIARWSSVEQKAHADEVADREALRLLDVAQSPNSDGGCLITLQEAAAIRSNVARSAELAHDVGDLAKL